MRGVVTSRRTLSRIDDEIEGLMSGLLNVDAPPAGTTRLSEWLGQNADTLGQRYTCETVRRRDR